jgi:hypothetical protein
MAGVGMKYRITIEINAEDEKDALYSVFDPEEDDHVDILQVREEPFDTPSRMWDVSTSRNGFAN